MKWESTAQRARRLKAEAAGRLEAHRVFVNGEFVASPKPVYEGIPQREGAAWWRAYRLELFDLQAAAHKGKNA